MTETKASEFEQSFFKYKFATFRMLSMFLFALYGAKFM